LLFEASIDTIVDIEIAQKLLGVAMHYTTAENANDTTTGNAKANSPVQDPSFLWPLCRGLCVNGNPKDAIELLFNYGTCPESYVNHCLSEIFDYYIANEDTEGMMDLFKRVKERRFVLGNYLGHQLLLHLDSLRSNNQEKVKNDMADIQNYLTKESNVLTQGIYRTLYSFAFRTKDTEILKQLEKEIISHDYDWQQIKTRVKMLDVCENGNELILDKEFNNSITSSDYLLEYKLLGDIMLRYVKDAEKIRDSAIGIHSKDFGLYCSRAFTTQAKALFIRTHVESEIYLRLMELAANNSNQKRAESLLKQAHRRGMNVTAEHYFHVVDALCNRGSVLQCKDIILDMYKEKIKPSIHIYNRLMKAYLDQKPNQKPSGNFVKAFAILEQFPRIWQTPNNETYSIFFKALLKDKKSSNSVKFIEILAAISASPSVKVFNHLMLQSLKEKNIKGVIRYFDLLQQSSENPNPETFEILITAYKQSNEFKIMFKTWNDLDRKFKNQNGYKQILDAYALKSDVKKFEKEFFDLKSLKSLDIKTCEDVLENMISLVVPVMAIDFIMTEMKSMGLIPNPEILRALLDLDESAKNSVDKNQAAVKSLDEKKELLKDYIAVVNPKIDKLLEKSIIPWAETDQKKLHDNYVEMDQLFSSTRRESRRRARATNKTV
jgi:tetratricopeptide (TPR) repeat protein